VKQAVLTLAAFVALAGCGRDNEEPPEGNAVTIEVPRSPSDQPGVTPMAERVAVLGLLNKRNGIVRDLTLKPGQAIRVKDVVVRLRACETTAPWESQKLTGAFVQVDVQRPDENWNRVFSGWLYKESPSLNVVEHAVYDVWPKSCTMSWPAAPGMPAAPRSSNNASSAPKSGGGNSAGSTPSNSGNEVAPAPAPAPAEPSAAANNTA
jgi:hypothetical protein